jgi:type III secretion protein C
LINSRNLRREVKTWLILCTCLSLAIAPSMYVHADDVPMEIDQLLLFNASDLPPTDGEEGDSGFIINFNNVGIIEYIRFVSRITNTNFVFDESQLEFKVTIVSEEPASVEQIVSILLQVLKARGFTMTEQGNQILISSDKQLAKLGQVVSRPGEDESAIITRVFRVENNHPDAMAEIIQPLLSADALVQPSEATGQLIVTDINNNVDRVATLLNAMDRPASEVEITEYRVQYADLQSLINLASRILEPLGTQQLTLVPQAASNTIFVVGTPYLANRAITILERLDVSYAEGEESEHGRTGTGAGADATDTAGPKLPWGGPKEQDYAGPKEVTYGGRDDVDWGLPGARTDHPHLLDGLGFFIYKLQYHQGDEIQLALRDIAQSLEASGVHDDDLVGTISTVQWLRASNSLVFSGPRTSLDKMKRLIQDLDIPLHQVFIEALILRTTISNALNIGVEWAINSAYENPDKSPTDAIVGGGGSTKGTTTDPLTGATVLSPLNQRINPLIPPTPLSFANGGFDLGVVGRFVSLDGKLFTSIGAIINAVQLDQDTTVMLNPKIVTQDNHTAQLFVGTNQAFIESTVSEPGSTILSGAIDYRDVGSLLKITPLLGNSDLVTLDITQSVSSSEGASTGASADPIQKSTTSTRVTVPDGYFLMISGQIATRENREHKGFPCLGALPVFGLAFSNKTHTDSRDNLIIFLRPHILRSRSDIARISEKEFCCWDEASTQREFKMTMEELRDILNIEENRHPLPTCE